MKLNKLIKRVKQLSWKLHDTSDKDFVLELEQVRRILEKIEEIRDAPNTDIFNSKMTDLEIIAEY